MYSGQLSKLPYDNQMSAEMQWGTNQEPLARTAYEIETGNEMKYPEMEECINLLGRAL